MHILDDDYSGFQSVCMVAIGVAFFMLVATFLSIEYEFIIYAIGCIAAIAPVYYFCRYLQFYTKSGAWARIIITACVFLLVPGLLFLQYRSSADDYVLARRPAGKTQDIKIEYEYERTGGSGSIGSDWSHRHYVNGERVYDGDVVSVNPSKTITVKTEIVEKDDIDDVGTTTNTVKLSDGKAVITDTIRVTERGGRKNSGAYADFRITYTVTKVNRVVKSDEAPFFDVLMSGSDESLLLTYILIASFAGCVISVPVVIFGGKARYEAALRAEEERKRQAFLREKDDFIRSLGGKRIRDAAGVPQNIIFVNGLPRDNNNSLYGSFTVYRSSNGTCYHNRRGCCSAYIEMHAFHAKERYRPCSKCYWGYIDIPEWYTRYIELQKKCKKYGIDCE